MSWRRLVQAVVVVAAAAVVYVGVLHHPFIYDDRIAVVDNPSIRDLGNLRWIFAGSHRFVTNFSYALDWRLWHGAPMGFHVTNVVIHAACAACVWLLLLEVVGDGSAALFGALLFAVHPIQTESVAYVASRPSLLTCLFLVASVWAACRAMHGRRTMIVVALAMCLLAAGAKETGLLAPLLWIAVSVLLFAPRRSAPKIAWLFGAVALLASVFAMLRLRVYVAHEGGSSLGTPSLWRTQIAAQWEYLRLIVLPFSLSVVHAPPSPPLWLSVGEVVAGVAVMVAAVRLRQVAPVVTFGVCWYVVLLLPSSLLPLRQVVAEHRIYESMVGVALAAAAAFATARSRWPTATPALAAALLLLVAVATLFRVPAWSSAIALWSDACQKAPQEWLPHAELADAQRSAQRCDLALPEYQSALTLAPRHLSARKNYAICLATLQRFDFADAQLRIAISQAPRDADAYFNLAMVRLGAGDPSQAHALLRSAAHLAPPGDHLACDELKRLFPEDDAAECRVR